MKSLDAHGRHGRYRQQAVSIRWYIYIGLHGLTSQETSVVATPCGLPVSYILTKTEHFSLSSL